LGKGEGAGGKEIDGNGLKSFEIDGNKLKYLIFRLILSTFPLSDESEQAVCNSLSRSREGVNGFSFVTTTFYPFSFYYRRLGLITGIPIVPT
jgi:hypothetical protein